MPAETIVNNLEPLEPEDLRGVGHIALGGLDPGTDPAGHLYREFPSLSAQAVSYRATLVPKERSDEVGSIGHENTQNGNGESIQPPEIESLEQRINNYKTKTSHLKILFQNYEFDPDLTEDLAAKAEMRDLLAEVTGLLPGLVIKADKEYDRPAIRDVIMTMVKLLDSSGKLKHVVLYSTDIEKAVDAIESTLTFADWDYPEGYYQHEKGSVFSDHEQHEILQLLLGQFAYNGKLNAASHYIRINSRDLLGKFGQNQTFWKNPVFLEYIGHMFAEDTIRAKEDWSNDYDLLTKAFEGYGFTAEEHRSIFGAWVTYSRQNKHFKSVVADRCRKSFSVMRRLMEHDSAAPHDLFSDFGIRNFYRYRLHSSIEQLISQWDIAKGIAPKPSGSTRLVVAATSDHNGAMDHDFENFRALKPVHTEAASLSELARRVVFVGKHFSPISNLTISAHGNKNGIYLSSSAGYSNTVLTKKDVLGSKALGRLRTKDYFVDGCKIILASCSTGISEAIGEMIAQKTQMPLVAPPFDAGTYIGRSEDGNEKYDVLLNGSPEPTDSGSSAWKKFIPKSFYRRVDYRPVYFEDGKVKRVKTIELPR